MLSHFFFKGNHDITNFLTYKPNKQTFNENYLWMFSDDEIMDGL